MITAPWMSLLPDTPVVGMFHFQSYGNMTSWSCQAQGGNDEPGMTLQRLVKRVSVDYEVVGGGYLTC